MMALHKVVLVIICASLSLAFVSTGTSVYIRKKYTVSVYNNIILLYTRDQVLLIEVSGMQRRKCLHM